MTTIQKILFALDFETLTGKIAPWVDIMTDKCNTELDVLHIIPKMEWWHVAYASSPSLFDDEPALIRIGEEKAEKFCSEHLKTERSRYTIYVKIDDPAQGIIDHIKNENISVVIMGSHGKKGLEKSLFGSVADRVLRLSPVPVFFVTTLTDQA